MENIDKLYASQRESCQDFVFDEATTEVFDDMLNRSVPFYNELQDMIATLGGKFIQDNSSVYDLGCSTGTTLALLAESMPVDRNIKFVGIDSSEPMLEKARQTLANKDAIERCVFKKADLNDPIELKDASLIVMTWTLQFVRPLRRDNLIKSIFDGLLPGGCFILLEKIISNDSMLSRMYIEAYHKFKEKQGYSKLEIAQKREALENVLIPYRTDEDIELLSRNGFSLVDIFFRWYNWAGFIAIKR